MGRKTIEVETVRDLGNRMIAAMSENVPADSDGRFAIGGFLEAVLHSSGNYKGFRYLASPDDVREGNYDPSARHYY